MKKSIVLFVGIAFVVTTSIAFINKKNSSGKAGFTGSPGEGTCSSASGGCHSGGSSSASSVTISSTPAFTNNEYVPGVTYTMEVTVNAAGFTKFGFGCEVLTATNANAGIMQNQGIGTKFLTAPNGRKNATQTTTQTGSTGFFTFSFEWIAPASGGGNVTFYYAGNAVNGTGGTGGDLGINGSLLVNEASTIGIKEFSQNIESLTISAFPNPANEFITISYDLTTNQNVNMELVNTQGIVIKTIDNGYESLGKQSHFLGLKTIPSGIYFLRVKADNVVIGQKTIVVN
jgi:hypothetical protein